VTGKTVPTLDVAAGRAWPHAVAHRGRTSIHACGPLLLSGLLAFAGIAAIVASDGGYRATTWGWSALAFSWLAALALVLDDGGLSWTALVALAGLAGLFGWILLSLLWTSSTTQTVLESQRTAVYLSGLAAALLVARRASYVGLLVGAWAGIVLIAGYALATRLFPDRLGVADPVADYRLSEPVGYWNGLGVLAAMGLLLAAVLAIRSRSMVLRSAAASTVPLLATTLYFTFSRGAWAAVAVGLVTVFVVDTRRLHLLCGLFGVVPWAVATVGIASQSEALTERGAPLAQAADEGRSVALLVVLLGIGAALSALGFRQLERSLAPSRAVRRGFAAALVIAVLAALGAVAYVYGSPLSVAERGYDNFVASTDPRTPPDLNSRLFTIASKGRAEHWKVAWNQFEANRLVGAGAGSFEQHWYRDRSVYTNVRDAHSLYLELAAELGAVGLALLLIALLAPIVAAMRARRRPLVAGTAGAYVIYIVHAGIDWDWELTGVTLAALLLGAGVLVAARKEQDAAVIGAPARVAGIVAALALSGFVAVGLGANSAIDAARDGAARGDLTKAAKETANATRWAPWSYEPWEVLAHAQLDARLTAHARRSFRRAIEKERWNWELWYGLARASTGRARLDALEEAERLNPLSFSVAVLRDATSTQP
jgi:O-antigen ligase